MEKLEEKCFEIKKKCAKLVDIVKEVRLLTEEKDYILDTLENESIDSDTITRLSHRKLDIDEEIDELVVDFDFYYEELGGKE